MMRFLLLLLFLDSIQGTVEMRRIRVIHRYFRLIIPVIVDKKINEKERKEKKRTTRCHLTQHN